MDRCVICGEPVPEGRQVCPGCNQNEGTVFEQLMRAAGIVHTENTTAFEIKDEMEQAFRQGYEEGMRQMEEKHLRELREAKRLLGEMLKVMNNGSCGKDCSDCKQLSSSGCDYQVRFEWKHTDEVVKLIGGEQND